MSDERAQRLDDFARGRHPGLRGVEVPACEPERATEWPVVTRLLVASAAFMADDRCD